MEGMRMQKDEAIKILARHLMQCGMLMPMEWVQKNGEDSEFMQAYNMAMDALKNEPVRCKDCNNYERKFAGYGYCYHWDYESGMSPNDVADNDFCSYGEKRREG
jgi:hypothetical protein